MDRIASSFPMVAGIALVCGFTGSGLCADNFLAGNQSTVPSAIPVWTSTSDLITARRGHTATLLETGKVLVVGGLSGDVLDSAELYDSKTARWSATGRMSKRRTFHTATRLLDGRVLVVGGATSFWPAEYVQTGTAELYDPATGSWSPTGSLTTTRSDHTATLLQSGKVLVAGCASQPDGSVGAAELFDPDSGTWTATGNMNDLHCGHTATRLANGSVLIAGGFYDAGVDAITGLAAVEVYDPVAGTWSKASDLNIGRGGHKAALLPNGEVLVAGGYQNLYPGGVTLPTSMQSSELFEPRSGKWTLTGGLNVGRTGGTATLLPDGTVLVAGGAVWHSSVDYASNSLSDASNTELYDPGTGRWTNAGNLNVARDGHTATPLPNGKVLIAGGSVVNRDFTETALGSAELYGPTVTAPETIGPGMTGSWYDPAQSGHGFMLEVLSGAPMRLFAGWFTFAPQGGQSWIAGVGQIDGSQAMVPAYQVIGGGGRFPPNFDAANVRQESWGTLTFTFTDCNHGRVDWVSPAPGYGSGGMDLTRLTLPAALACGASSLGQ